VAGLFEVSDTMAREIMYENDEGGIYGETDNRRWVRMRSWVQDQIRPESAGAP
jgi:hypothetical protein